jgi:hypothetical protein
MSDSLGMIIESFVAILLILTITYCMLLNRRLKRLKADEGALRATIAELVAATGAAERAIAGLKHTARECDAGLGERLSRGERLCAELEHRIAAGKLMLMDLSQGATATQSADKNRSRPQDVQAIAAAAQAFAERLRSKATGLAA